MASKNFSSAQPTAQRLDVLAESRNRDVAEGKFYNTRASQPISNDDYAMAIQKYTSSKDMSSIQWRRPHQ